MARDVALVLGGSMVIAASAQVSMHTAWTNIPVTGQTFGVLLVAATLGMHRGAAAVIAYLMEGGMGLPVFAGGAAGWPVFATASGGYLVAFVAGAMIVGWLSDHGWMKRPLTAAASVLLGETVILLCGALWLVQSHGFEGAMLRGYIPFVPGAVVKVALATAALPMSWKALAAIQRN
jgi:biotin transport system substrate-specific component